MVECKKGKIQIQDLGTDWELFLPQLAKSCQIVTENRLEEILCLPIPQQYQDEHQPAVMEHSICTFKVEKNRREEIRQVL